MIPTPRAPLSLLPLLLCGTALGGDFDHVLVIVADDLGVDKVGAYAGDVDDGGTVRPATPTIDALAASGVRFTAAWANPVCSPSRAALYSGEYPYRTGVGDVLNETSTARLGASPSTLPKVMSEAARRPALFGKWHVGEVARSPDAPKAAFPFKEVPIQDGFGYFDGSMDAYPASYSSWLRTLSQPAGMAAFSTSAEQLTTPATDVVVADAVAWMNGTGNARRFAVVALNLPHGVGAGGAEEQWDWADPVTSCGGVPTGDSRLDYDLSVACLDDAVHTLLTTMPKLEKTLVVFVSDNGTPTTVASGAFADGRGKGTVYETGVRVPFIFADGAAVLNALGNGGVPTTVDGWKLPAGVTRDGPAHLVDVYRTVLDYTGATPRSCTPGTTCARDSVSLKAAITGTGTPRSSVYTERYWSEGGQYVGDAALREGDLKLVVHANDPATRCRTYEMYNLADDPFEAVDLAADPTRAEARVALIALLDAEAAKMTVAWLPAEPCTWS